MKSEKLTYKPMGEPQPARTFIVDVTEYGGPYTELEKVGCTIEEIDGLRVRVTYPPGTTRVFLWPATMNWVYRVMVPDGTELREVSYRGKTNYLYFVTKKEEQPE